MNTSTTSRRWAANPGARDLVIWRVAFPAPRISIATSFANVRDRAGLRGVREGLAERDLGGATDRRDRVGGSGGRYTASGIPSNGEVRPVPASMCVDPGFDRHAAGDHDERKLPITGVVAHGCRERPPAERQELPAGRRGRDRRDRVRQMQVHRCALMCGLPGTLRARDASASRRSRQVAWRRGAPAALPRRAAATGSTPSSRAAENAARNASPAPTPFTTVTGIGGICVAVPFWCTVTPSGPVLDDDDLGTPRAETGRLQLAVASDDDVRRLGGETRDDRVLLGRLPELRAPVGVEHRQHAARRASTHETDRGRAARLARKPRAGYERERQRDERVKVEISEAELPVGTRRRPVEGDRGSGRAATPRRTPARCAASDG